MVTEKIGAAQLMSIGVAQGAKCEGAIMCEVLLVGKDVEAGYLLARWGIGGGLLRTPRPTANAGGKPKEIKR
jgi:hypothetical protein